MHQNITTSLKRGSGLYLCPKFNKKQTKIIIAIYQHYFTSNMVQNGPQSWMFFREEWQISMHTSNLIATKVENTPVPCDCMQVYLGKNKRRLRVPFESLMVKIDKILNTLDEFSVSGT